MGHIKRDPWLGLSRHTVARIALGRTGGSLPSEALLEFRLAHARARDAVQLPLDAGSLARALAAERIETLHLSTLASDRQTFLLRPDLGRRLTPDARQLLLARRDVWGSRHLTVIVSDGLSALAAERQVAPLLAELVPRLTAAGFSLYPVLVVPFARVKLADEIGELLAARQSLILLGERPGLTAPDSLGAYLTYHPHTACTDADRNCISNIRALGLPVAHAAEKLFSLLTESARLGVSGVALKESEPARAALG